MLTLKNGLTIGHTEPTRVNCNIGCSRLSDYDKEIRKLHLINESGILPDMMMDLSLVELDKPLYLSVRDDLGLPFGTVLSYQPFDKSIGLNWKRTKQHLLKLCNEGLSFVTIHYTADIDLFEEAKKIRKIPITSRGGGIVLYDTVLNSRKQNLFREYIDEIIDIVLEYDIVISLGTTFRPGTILDACDYIHIEETKRQLDICRYLQKRKVKVMVENVGHISLDKLFTHAELLRQFNAPIMPLGPLPTDIAVNEDHIANAIGSTVAASMGVAHIINCISRYEHSNSDISADATIEAIRSARIAAHIADITRNVPRAVLKEQLLTDIRASIHSCFADGTLCPRCSNVCPLKMFSDD